AGAIPETVGDAGLLVPPGDVDALAAALGAVLADDALRASLAGKARSRADALPSWAESSARFAAAIEDLTASGGSSAEAAAAEAPRTTPPRSGHRAAATKPRGPGTTR